MKFLQFIGALACLHLVSSQCTRESLDNSAVVGSLLARSLAGTQSTPPTVNVIDYTVVCLAVNTVLDQYRFASVVVLYNCTGACPPDGTSGFLSQVEFGCTNNVWSDVVSGTNEGNVATPPAMATLQTQLISNCRTCLNPGREMTSMEPNHCVECSGCLPPDEGLNVCTGSGASQCCNVNITGQCRDSCPPGTIPDPGFVCRASCADDPLPTAEFQTGVLDDSNCSYAGCSATYTCDEGLTLSDITSTSYQLRCLEGGSAFTANWDVNTRTCSQRCNFVHDNDARARGFMIEYEPPGCNATFGTTNCFANYISSNGSASCNCTLNDTTGMIRCDSLEVATLIMDTPTTTTMSTPETNGGLDDRDRDIIIGVVCCVGGISVVAAIIIMIGITYYCCSKKKAKAKIQVNELDQFDSK